MSSAEDPAELPADFDLLLCLVPEARLLLDCSPPDLAEDLSDPESEEEPDPLDPLDEDEDEPLDDDPDPELELEPSSPDPSSSDEDPPPDAEDADLDCLPPPVGGRLGGILLFNINSIGLKKVRRLLTLVFTFYTKLQILQGSNLTSYCFEKTLSCFPSN